MSANDIRADFYYTWERTCDSYSGVKTHRGDVRIMSAHGSSSSAPAAHGISFSARSEHTRSELYHHGERWGKSTPSWGYCNSDGEWWRCYRCGSNTHQVAQCPYERKCWSGRDWSSHDWWNNAESQRVPDCSYVPSSDSFKSARLVKRDIRTKAILEERVKEYNHKIALAKEKRDNGESSPGSDEGFHLHPLDARHWNKSYSKTRLELWEKREKEFVQESCVS